MNAAAAASSNPNSTYSYFDTSCYIIPEEKSVRSCVFSDNCHQLVAFIPATTFGHQTFASVDAQRSIYAQYDACVFQFFQYLNWKLGSRKIRGGVTRTALFVQDVLKGEFHVGWLMFMYVNTQDKSASEILADVDNCSDDDDDDYGDGGRGGGSGDDEPLGAEALNAVVDFEAKIEQDPVVANARAEIASARASVQLVEQARVASTHDEIVQVYTKFCTVYPHPLADEGELSDDEMKRFVLRPLEPMMPAYEEAVNRVQLFIDGYIRDKRDTAVRDAVAAAAPRQDRRRGRARGEDRNERPKKKQKTPEREDNKLTRILNLGGRTNIGRWLIEFIRCSAPFGRVSDPSIYTDWHWLLAIRGPTFWYDMATSIAATHVATHYARASNAMVDQRNPLHFTNVFSIEVALAKLARDLRIAAPGKDRFSIGDEGMGEALYGPILSGREDALQRRQLGAGVKLGTCYQFNGLHSNAKYLATHLFPHVQPHINFESDEYYMFRDTMGPGKSEKQIRDMFCVGAVARHGKAYYPYFTAFLDAAYARIAGSAKGEDRQQAIEAAIQEYTLHFTSNFPHSSGTFRMIKLQDGLLDACRPSHTEPRTLFNKFPCFVPGAHTKALDLPPDAPVSVFSESMMHTVAYLRVAFDVADTMIDAYVAITVCLDANRNPNPKAGTLNMSNITLANLGPPESGKSFIIALIRRWFPTAIRIAYSSERSDFTDDPQEWCIEIHDEIPRNIEYSTFRTMQDLIAIIRDNRQSTDLNSRSQFSKSSATETITGTKRATVNKDKNSVEARVVERPNVYSRLVNGNVSKYQITSAQLSRMVICIFPAASSEILKRLIAQGAVDSKRTRMQRFTTEIQIMQLIVGHYFFMNRGGMAADIQYEIVKVYYSAMCELLTSNGIPSIDTPRLMEMLVVFSSVHTLVQAYYYVFTMCIGADVDPGEEFSPGQAKWLEPFLVVPPSIVFTNAELIHTFRDPVEMACIRALGELYFGMDYQNDPNEFPSEYGVTPQGMAKRLAYRSREANIATHINHGAAYSDQDDYWVSAEPLSMDMSNRTMASIVETVASFVRYQMKPAMGPQDIKAALIALTRYDRLVVTDSTGRRRKTVPMWKVSNEMIRNANCDFHLCIHATAFRMAQRDFVSNLGCRILNQDHEEIVPSVSSHSGGMLETQTIKKTYDPQVERLHFRIECFKEKIGQLQTSIDALNAEAHQKGDEGDHRAQIDAMTRVAAEELELEREEKDLQKSQDELSRIFTKVGNPRYANPRAVTSVYGMGHQSWEKDDFDAKNAEIPVTGHEYRDACVRHLKQLGVVDVPNHFAMPDNLARITTAFRTAVYAISKYRAGYDAHIARVPRNERPDIDKVRGIEADLVRILRATRDMYDVYRQYDACPDRVSFARIRQFLGYCNGIGFRPLLQAVEEYVNLVVVREEDNLDARDAIDKHVYRQVRVDVASAAASPPSSSPQSIDVDGDRLLDDPLGARPMVVEVAESHGVEPGEEEADKEKKKKKKEDKEKKKREKERKRREKKKKRREEKKKKDKKKKKRSVFIDDEAAVDGSDDEGSEAEDTDGCVDDESYYSEDYLDDVPEDLKWFVDTSEEAERPYGWKDVEEEELDTKLKSIKV